MVHREAMGVHVTCAELTRVLAAGGQTRQLQGSARVVQQENKHPFVEAIRGALPASSSLRALRINSFWAALKLRPHHASSLSSASRSRVGSPLAATLGAGNALRSSGTK